MSGSTQLSIIAACQALQTLAALAAVAVLIYGVVSLKRLVNSKVNEAIGKIQPIVDQAQSIAEQARDTAEKVSEKVDAMVTRAETTVERVGEKVDSISAKVEEGISPQVVTVAGIVGTAVKCAQIYKDIVSAKQASQERTPPEES